MNRKLFKQQLLLEAYAPYKNSSGCLVGTHGCTQLVFGEGNPDAHLLLIGEAPGKDEDQQGRPFVGRSGKLLTRCLEKAGIARSDVFITNLVKCRPPDNRTPLPDEVQTFKPLLLQEIKIIRPQIIATLGSSALQGLIERPVSITKIHGRPIEYYSMNEKIPLIPLYHPAYILRNQSAEIDFQQDIAMIAELITKIAQ
jgi:uracil-DNA glycosylase family 4